MYMYIYIHTCICLKELQLKIEHQGNPASFLDKYKLSDKSDKFPSL